MKFLKKIWSDEKGEDVAEYALVMGLVAIAAIVGLGLTGGALQAWWQGLADTIEGIGVPVAP